MSDNVYRKMLEQAVPSAALIHKTKSKMKEESLLTKHNFRVAAVTLAVMLMISTTAFAAWYFLKPSDVANKFNDSSLAASFDSETAVNINKSITSGDHTFTLLALVSGKDITDHPTYSNSEMRSDRTYAVLAIQKVDGSPMPSTQDDEYGQVSFITSPLVKGLMPWRVNAWTMNGGHSEIVADGILYRIVDCDSVTMFADRGVYLGVATGSFINNSTFIYDENTGEIKANPDYDGSSAVFDIPFDKSLADPIKSEQYIDSIFSDDTAEHSDNSASPGTNNEWDTALPVISTIKEVAVGADGLITYTFDTDEYGGGTISCLSEFTDNPEPQSFIASIMQTEGPNGVQKYAVQFSKDENDIITGMIVVPNLK